MKGPARIPKAMNFALGMAMTAVVCYVDIRTPEALMSFFYLVPIIYVTWYCGSRWGLAISCASAVVWLYVDITTGSVLTSRPLIHYWNAATHLAIFFVVNLFVALLVEQRRFNKMEHAVSELKSSLVSLVSHEFGNSLTIYRLGLTNLRESEPTAPSAERLQHYAMLERVYAHLASATTNFLNLNRIESGRFVPNIRKTSLLPLVHSSIAMQDSAISHKHLSLSTHIPPGPILVLADPDALSVILGNLLGNAIKYTPDGGSVSVRITLLPPDAALIAVEDSGIGISREDIPLISSGHYRTKNGQSTAKGFGIGLKVVHDLLANQNSHLEIDSTPRQGSRFSFRLPLWHEEPPPDIHQPV